jgi:CHAT domain-containing protein
MDASALVVAVPYRPGSVPLRHAGEEAAAVRRVLTAGTDLLGDTATRAAVKDSVADHEVLHFACHGHDDNADPLRSGLLLAGTEELTTRDILTLPGLHARLAVLSACETATYGTALAEEMVGLPVAFLGAGAAGVIGTLWEVVDLAAMLLVRRFFEEWVDCPAGPAMALRRAQAWLKQADNQTLHAWSPNAPELAPPGDPELRRLWAPLRPYASPQYWASFSYLGW